MDGHLTLLRTAKLVQLEYAVGVIGIYMQQFYMHLVCFWIIVSIYGVHKMC